MESLNQMIGYIQKAGILNPLSVMDKVSFHHSSVVKDTWEQVGREIL